MLVKGQARPSVLNHDVNLIRCATSWQTANIQRRTMLSKDSFPSFERKKKLSYDSSFHDRVKAPRVPKVSTEYTHIEKHNVERRTDKSDDPEHGVLSPPYTNSIVSPGSPSDEKIELDTDITYRYFGLLSAPRLIPRTSGTAWGRPRFHLHPWSSAFTDAQT